MSNSIIRGGTTSTLMLSWLKDILIKHTTNTVIYIDVLMQNVSLAVVVTMLFPSSCFVRDLAGSKAFMLLDFQVKAKGFACVPLRNLIRAISIRLTYKSFFMCTQTSEIL